MLAGPRAKPAKGQAYSQLHVLMGLSHFTQLFLMVMFVLALYGMVQLFPSQRLQLQPPANGADTGSVFSGASANAKAADVASSSEYRQQLQQLLEENSKLKAQVSTQSAGSGHDMLQGRGAAPGGPPANLRGAPLGPFNWEKLQFEQNSTERRFWIKTATNEEGHHFYRRILVSNGWIETADPKHPDCYWQFYGRFVPNLASEFTMFEEGKHMINHIPGEFAILNKEPFLHFMRNNSKAVGCDYTIIHPESYLIHDETDCRDMFAFGDQPTNKFIVTKESQAERDDSYWFWKPPFNSFGRGIKVSQLKALREQFGFGEEMARNTNREQLLRERCAWLATNLTDAESKLLVQRAIHKPYLIKGSKFDFRAYILIANTSPYMVYFKFGHARRCLRPFDVASPIKKAHVCNDYSDELETPGFPLDEHIWSYDKFKAYLVGVGYTPDEVERAFIHNLKRLFLSVFRRFKDPVPRKNGYWLLLGLDVAIDENWNCRVLEVNTNPSMHYGTRIWGTESVERNWRQMNEVLELVYDAHVKSKRLPIPKSDLVLHTKYGFELLYSEYTDPVYAVSDETCYHQAPQTRHPSVH